MPLVEYSVPVKTGGSLADIIQSRLKIGQDRSLNLHMPFQAAFAVRRDKVK